MKTPEKKYTSEFLRLAHKGSSCHKAEIMDSTVCGCFYCCKTFLPAEIDEGGRGETAVCPECGIDSVLGASFPVEGEAFLKEMHVRWFND